MINRNVDLNDLSKFDFFNDARDTAGWLRSIGRSDDAAKLIELGNKHHEAFIQRCIDRENALRNNRGPIARGIP